MNNNFCEQALAVAEHNYVIVNRVCVPHLKGQWPFIELVSPMIAPQAHLYPWLLSTTELSFTQWQALRAELAKETPYSLPPHVLLLKSAQPTKRLHDYLVGALHLVDEAYNQHILRYYDARVFFHLCWMLTPWQHAFFIPLNMVSHWTFWLRGRWHTYASPPLPKHPSQPGEKKFPFNRVRHIGEINQVLAHITDDLSLQQLEEKSKAIEKLLEQAERIKLPTSKDRIAFAQHGLAFGDEFWNAPMMKTFLLQCRQAPDCYCNETMSWDENRWLEMTKKKSNLFY